MWPLDFEGRGEREVLRLGRHGAERWCRPYSALQRVGVRALPQPGQSKNGPTADELATMLRQLYAQPPRSKVTAVVESIWMPVQLVGLGDALISRSQVDALVRHRLGLQFGPSQALDGEWEVRLDYRPGDPQAMGFAVRRSLMQSLVAAGNEVGISFAAVVPALAWGLDRFVAGRRWKQVGNQSSKRLWWLWPEQDRLLIARVQAGRVVGLNPGAALLGHGEEGDEEGAGPSMGSTEQVERAVRIEALRAGEDAASDSIAVGSWMRPRLAKDLPSRISWLSVQGESEAAALETPASSLAAGASP